MPTELADGLGLKDVPRYKIVAISPTFGSPVSSALIKSIAQEFGRLNSLFMNLFDCRQEIYQ